ncbi:hypothetical protein FJU30_12975 [Affinibrenneria salicis]|uniref:Uncharacterized protein n=1 Tax=Affinibrenneria salicis TaxID=2590031 RepID=A0A5J5G0M2_9GAMM|nr:hypothetical protein FJU30_12975 [Affinibrenneria salicis]
MDGIMRRRLKGRGKAGMTGIKKMTPTEAGVRELCANTRENGHLRQISAPLLAGADSQMNHC